MGMIHNYDDFCKYYDQGLVKPDINSPLGWKSVETLMKIGWEIDSKNILGFQQNFKISKKLLSICRQSKENFETAYRQAGIDFWIEK